MGLALSLVRSTPYTMSKYQSRRMEDAVARVLTQTTPDVVMVEGIHLAPYARWARQRGYPTVMRVQNVETTIWQRLALYGHSLQRMYARLQLPKVQPYEVEALRIPDVVIALSPVDAQALRVLAPAACIQTCSPGVDTSHYAPAGVSQEGIVASVCSLDWLPNADGVRWLVREVFPLVQQGHAGVRLWLVGRRPPTDIQALAGDVIAVKGDVPDERPDVAQATVIVVPLRMGSGVRMRILTAMAMGKAIVTTPVGAEGLPVRDGEHLLIREDAPSFARAVLALLQDGTERRRLGEAARRLVQEHFTWDQAAANLEAVFTEVMTKR